MIAFLSGSLLEKKDTCVVVDAQGVGYEVFCSPVTVASLPDLGQPCRLHIHTQYKNDGVALFGFTSSQEKALFLSLIKVDSVGPKSALNIMAAAPWEEIAHLIEDGDVAALSKLPKISKKTAEHVVVKLKGKLGELLMSAATEPAPEGTGSAAPRRARTSLVHKMRAEAQSALSHLGFRPQDVEKTLEGLSEDAWSGDVQTVIRHALNHLSGNT